MISFALPASSRIRSRLLEQIASIGGCAQYLEELFEIVGEGGFELDRLRGDGVLECDAVCVQGLTWKTAAR